jgi:hypothetical protein
MEAADSSETSIPKHIATWHHWMLWSLILREVLDSDLSPDTSCSDWCLLFSSVHRGKCQDGTSNRSMAAAFHTVSNSLFTCRIWGFHSGGYEESVELQPTFRRNIASIFRVEETGSAKPASKQNNTLVLVSYWFAGLVHVCCRFHSVIWTSEWEPSSSLLLTFCLLYILVFRLADYSACLLDFAELISSSLKMEAICSSETSVVTRRTTRRHISEDDTLPCSLIILPYSLRYWQGSGMNRK